MVQRCIFFFFFSSRRRHTRSKRDWSSDVCSSDLVSSPPNVSRKPSISADVRAFAEIRKVRPPSLAGSTNRWRKFRSEERRVGKECRSRWATEHEKKKKVITGERAQEKDSRQKVG